MAAKILHTLLILECSIIFVHELGGGPEKTWSSSRLSKTSENLQEPLSSSKARRRDQIRVKLKSVIGSSQPNPSCTEEGRQTTLKIKTFWPLDFLPKDFPRSRIITFGYDSKAVAQFFSGEAVNQENYHSHARDLLYDVDESRAKDGVSTKLQPKRFLVYLLENSENDPSYGLPIV